MHISPSYAKILGETNFQPREFPRRGSKAKYGENTQGTAGGPGGHDRTLAVKSRKNTRKSFFFRNKIKITKKHIFFAYILYLIYSYSKILGETNFRTREIPRSGSKAKDGENGRKKETKTERS